MLGFPVDLGDVFVRDEDATRPGGRVASAQVVLVDEQDAQEFYDVIDAAREDLRVWLPWVDSAKDASFPAAYFRDARRRRDAGEGLECGIRLGGRIVGGIGIHHVDLRNRCGEIGYWLAPKARGSGLATRAVAAVESRAFALGFHRLEIRLWPGNAKSRAVAERLGYVREGVLREAGWHPDGWRDLEVWAKLAP